MFAVGLAACSPGAKAPQGETSPGGQPSAAATPSPTGQASGTGPAAYANDFPTLKPDDIPLEKPDGSPLDADYCQRVGAVPGNPFSDVKTCLTIACQGGDPESCVLTEIAPSAQPSGVPSAN